MQIIAIINAFGVLAVPISLLWISFSLGAFLYQLDNYLDIRRTHLPQLRAWRNLTVQLEGESALHAQEAVIRGALSGTLAAELEEDRYSLWSGMAAMTISIETAISLLCVHVYLVLIGVAALLTAVDPSVLSAGASISLAGVGSISLTTRLVWLTRYTTRQYETISQGIAAFRKP